MSYFQWIIMQKFIIQDYLKNFLYYFEFNYKKRHLTESNLKISIQIENVFVVLYSISLKLRLESSLGKLTFSILETTGNNLLS